MNIIHKSKSYKVSDLFTDTRSGIHFFEQLSLRIINIVSEKILLNIVFDCIRSLYYASFSMADDRQQMEDIAKSIEDAIAQKELEKILEKLEEARKLIEKNYGQEHEYVPETS